MEEPIPEDFPDLEGINRELLNKEQENQHLRSRNFGLQDVAESNFMPKNDSNVIEFKLSAEELLERIEHYLRGDVLKTRVNEERQVETYYSAPTKRISVSIYKQEKTGRIYIVNEHPQGIEEEDWEVLSIFEKDEELKGMQESEVEKNYQTYFLKEIKDGLNSKKDKIIFVGYGTKEIIDTSRTNLSEYGVQEVMNLLSMYISKETFLSWYKEDRIYEILGDLGDQLNKFFLINGKMLGLDTEYKKTKYPVIVVIILHTVENAYRRALLGSENKGTREGIIVTQHQPMGGYQDNFAPQRVPKKKWSPFDKTTW